MPLIFDCIVLLIVGWSAWKGYRKGVVKQLLLVVGVVVGLTLGVKLVTLMSKAIESSVNPKQIPVIAAFLVLFFMIVSILLVNKLINKLLKKVFLHQANKLLGAGVSVFFALSLVAALCYVISHAKITSPSFEGQSITYLPMVKLAPQLYKFSLSVLPIIKEVFTEFIAFLKNLPIK